MKIKLSKKESLEYFHNALCNGLDYIRSYSLIVTYSKDDYNVARQKLSSPCYEDVLIQILKDGNPLMLNDYEAEEMVSITIQDVYDRVQLTPIDHLNDMINEQDDAVTSDVILQTVFYKEIIFG